MKVALIAYLILNSSASIAGCMWTLFDVTSHTQPPMCTINYRMPITYLLPGYVVGHYFAKAVTYEIK